MTVRGPKAFVTRSSARAVIAGHGTFVAVTPLEELALLLRPASGGLYLVSTGREAQLALQRKLYGAKTDAEVDTRFRAALAGLASARAFVLGIPSDVGAGFRRGANLGPQAIRTQLLEELPDWPTRSASLGVVDIGDVFVVPQLLHDDMLSDAQKEATRVALYPNVAPEVRSRLPVSPLSIAERALDLVFSINPGIAPIVIGGDHSTAWPVASALSRARKDRWGIVQPDAHTDLLEERLGIKYCFATWSWHANELLGRDGRMVQVGTRASRRDREHWEGKLGVRQFWATDCLKDPEGSLDALIAHLKERKVSSVYFSNDIDGTDSTYADATGTPEPGGLEPEFVVKLIRRLGAEIGMLGGDVMEVAPPLRDKPDSSERTVALAVRYLRETLGAVLRTEV
jgi:agmatinase